MIPVTLTSHLRTYGMAMFAAAAIGALALLQGSWDPAYGQGSCGGTFPTPCTPTPVPTCGGTVPCTSTPTPVTPTSTNTPVPPPPATAVPATTVPSTSVPAATAAPVVTETVPTATPVPLSAEIIAVIGGLDGFAVPERIAVIADSFPSFLANVPAEAFAASAGALASTALADLVDETTTFAQTVGAIASTVLDSAPAEQFAATVNELTGASLALSNTAENRLGTVSSLANSAVDSVASGSEAAAAGAATAAVLAAAPAEELSNLAVSSALAALNARAFKEQDAFFSEEPAPAVAVASREEVLASILDAVRASGAPADQVEAILAAVQAAADENLF